MKKKQVNAYQLAFVGVMAAMVYVVTLFRFPLLGSKVHFANAVCLLAGMLIWSSVASIDSFVTGTAQVEDGSMHILLDDEQFASVIQPGMLVKVGESECRILSIGTSPSGTTFATAETPLADGSYSARIILRQTQVLRLLFN